MVAPRCYWMGWRIMHFFSNDSLNLPSHGVVAFTVEDQFFYIS